MTRRPCHLIWPWRKAACCLEAAAAGGSMGGKKLIVEFMADMEEALTSAASGDGVHATLREKAAAAHAATLKVRRCRMTLSNPR